MIFNGRRGSVKLMKIYNLNYKILLKLFYFFNDSIHAYRYNNLIQQKIKANLTIDGYVDENDNVNISGPYHNYTINENGKINSNESWSLLNKFNASFNITQREGNYLFTEMINFGVGDTFFINVNRKSIQIQYSIPASINKIRQYGSVSSDGKIIYFFVGNKIISLYPDGSYKIKQIHNINT